MKISIAEKIKKAENELKLLKKKLSAQENQAKLILGNLLLLTYSKGYHDENSEYINLLIKEVKKIKNPSKEIEAMLAYYNETFNRNRKLKLKRK